LASALVATVWFALNQHAPRGPLVLGWVSPPVSLALGALAMHTTAGTPGLAPAAASGWLRSLLGLLRKFG